jgi:hypothetical protein
MKMKREHVVPLAPQAVAVLRELRALEIQGPWRENPTAFWRRDRILFENGGMMIDAAMSVPDEVVKEALNAGIVRYRLFLLKRADVQRLWRKQGISGQQVSTGARKAGRPTTRAAIENTLAKMREEGKSFDRYQNGAGKRDTENKWNK